MLVIARVIIEPQHQYSVHRENKTYSTNVLEGDRGFAFFARAFLALWPTTGNVLDLELPLGRLKCHGTGRLVLTEEKGYRTTKFLNYIEQGLLRGPLKKKLITSK